MKKILAILMAVLMAFSALSVVAMAEETADTEIVVEEENRDFKNDAGLVYPENFTQLISSIFVKLFESVIKFFSSIIENIFPDVNVDQELADGTGELGDAIADRIEQLFPQA